VVEAAVLQEAGPLEGEMAMLTGMKLPVTRHLDVGEVDKTAARHLGGIGLAVAL
jgi:hypothetical protein